MAEEMRFGWDDEVPESEIEVLPDGDYAFTVTKFERAWFEPKNPDSKIGSCDQANIEFTINWVNKDGVQKTSKLVYRLKLWKTLAFQIYQFFESIGLRKKGDGTARMPWDQVVGKTGICMIGHHTDSKGNDYNDILKCYVPDSAPTVTKNQQQTPATPKFSL